MAKAFLMQTIYSDLDFPNTWWNFKLKECNQIQKFYYSNLNDTLKNRMIWNFYHENSNSILTVK